MRIVSTGTIVHMSLVQPRDLDEGDFADME